MEQGLSLQVSAPAHGPPLCGAECVNLPYMTSKRNFLPQWAVWALQRTAGYTSTSLQKHGESQKAGKRGGGGGLRKEPEGRHLVCERKVLKWKKGKDTEGGRVAHLEECLLLTHKTLASIPTLNKQTGHGGSACDRRSQQI